MKKQDALKCISNDSMEENYGEVSGRICGYFREICI